MHPSHYLAIAIRIFAIGLFLYGLRQLGLVYEVFVNDALHGFPVSRTFALGTSILPVIVSVVMWRFPLSVARRIATPEIDLPLEPLRARSILAALIGALSLFFLFYAVVDAVYWATYWHMVQSGEIADAVLRIGGEQKANTLATIVELVVATGILLKSNTLAAYILRVAQ